MRMKPNSVDSYMEDVQLPPGNEFFKTFNREILIQSINFNVKITFFIEDKLSALNLDAF